MAQLRHRCLVAELQVRRRSCGARVLLRSQGMNRDDAHTSHNHGFELPNAPQVPSRRDPGPWRAVAGVALCLGLAGIVTGLIVARRQSASDEHLTADALQREDLREGWRALGAAAALDARAQDAQSNTAQANTAASAAAPQPNVVIVNVPAQGAPAAPPNVTNITLPSSATTGSPTVNTNPNYTPAQSIPPINFSPVPGYLPPPAGYTAPLSGDRTRMIYSPEYSYGATPGDAAPIAPPVGNGTIPGSAPNPASPNDGLVGAPSLPTGSGVTPSTPVGVAPVSPGTTSLPSGFSAP